MMFFARTLASVGFAVTTITAMSVQAQSPGISGYETHCSGCHQSSGEGMEGVFPSLKGTPFVQGDSKAMANIILNGRGDNMPPFADTLSDSEIADIATYVRGSWGSKAAAAVTAAEVAEQRKSKK